MLRSGGATLKSTLLSALLVFSAAVGFSQTQSKGPTVFINGNGAISTSSKSGSDSVTVATPPDLKHDQTIQMAQELLKRCPQVSLTLERTVGLADYELLLHRQGTAASQFMIVRGSDKAIVFANEKLSVASAMRASCKAILADWRQGHTSQVASAPWNITKPEATK